VIFRQEIVGRSEPKPAAAMKANQRWSAAGLDVTEAEAVSVDKSFLECLAGHGLSIIAINRPGDVCL